jgi:hypothetical protein
MATVKTSTRTATAKSTKTKEPKGPLSINIQQDYITLRTPNGNFTSSWNGVKASGKLASDIKSFKAIDEYVQSFQGTVGEAIKSLTDPTTLTKLWPNWNQEVPKNIIKVSDKVGFRARSPFKRKYKEDYYVVAKIAPKYIYVKIGKELVGFDYQELEVKND